ncbi:P-loop NTPase fold protein [Rhizobium sp. YJ-22]|uniref:KAP family P-loop NTPase fold protein n=1 Tax=Rhizobium sp. YJ-22 TaxID=3037556 RepID=UPI002412AAC2|nr:P-loop NTPase fold protein [Rhizobium sp. YJ-22]MDG3576975.1 P-loop NTPase fold protein [Rhizobium sp. YJ-22]
MALYEEGFGESDLLGRKATGQRISELLERVEDPIVLAVDGPWGSGKSYFLKRWVGAHTVENSGAATTVYFDAFANDYLDDPLIGLTGAIGDRLPAGKPQKSWKKAKNVVATVARPALRIAAAFATAGVTEITGPLVDAAVEAAGKEAQDAAEAFWKREDGRRAAMLQFRAALSELTNDGKPLPACARAKPVSDEAFLWLGIGVDQFQKGGKSELGHVAHFAEFLLSTDLI